MFQNLCDYGETGNSSCHQKNTVKCQSSLVNRLVSYVSSGHIHYVELKQLQETELISHFATVFTSKTISRFLIRL